MNDVKPPRGLRTVKFWVLYDPRTKGIIEIQPYKYLLPEPSKESGNVIFQSKGFYVQRSPGGT